jgi:UDP-N-acetylmuramate dehydrogenase
MKDLFGKIPGIKVLKDELMAKHTSFYIGGNADYFVKVYSKRALKRILHVIKKRRLNYLVIGAGTNLLVSNKGFRGVFIRLDGSFKTIRKNDIHFYCGAGSLLEDLLKNTSKSGYGGVEFLAGIPGTVGGAIRGNAGAFGHSVADITEKIIVINKDVEEKEIDKQNIGFAYRTSRIKNGTIIISATIKLVKKKKKEIIKTIKRNLRYRMQRHPTGYSAGSFFKNPPGCSAGKLIEECGLKGLRVGDAEVSRKHANYIINLGQARASDVITLARKIKRIVRNKKDIILKEEVKILN